ncbi:MAG: hypothetical protein GPJ54_06940 [Candidatus Heimdallarchaeota archaeon]|nr:hypothetical protein [Candidatus Heimdallarchaeota archaeon]
MAKKDENLGKEIIKSIKNENTDDQTKENKEMILSASEAILNSLPSLSEKYPDGIPYTVLHEGTNYSYDLIQVAVMHLIMTKKIYGFINDRSTSDLTDDILILREKRIIDELESSYRTG